jgi:hypothetical protein
MRLSGEAVDSFSPVAASHVSVRWIPVPRAKDRRRGALVSAVGRERIFLLAMAANA